jgi:hypothetical protein
MALALTALSESDVKSWLGGSEILLVGSAIVLVIGLLGEWPESWSWKRRKIYKLAKLAVVLGVVGALVGDAGIFESAQRLQQLADSKTEALRTANLALEAQIAPRNLSPAAQQDIANALRPYSGKQVRLRAYAVDAEGIRLALQIDAILKLVNIQSFFLTPVESGMPRMGVNVAGPPSEAAFAEAISTALGKYLVMGHSSPQQSPSEGTLLIWVGVRPLAGPEAP